MHVRVAALLWSHDNKNKGVNIMADTIGVFKAFYSELTKAVPMIINGLVTELYSSNLLSGDHKEYIDSQTTDKEKTKYFLDKVIKPSLEVKYTGVFDEMLKIMKSSDDPTVNHLVDKIFNSLGNQTQATQSKGNYC